MESEQAQVDFYQNLAWSTPKIIKYGNKKYLAIYDLEIEADSLDDQEFIWLDSIITHLCSKLKQNEFRKLVWRGKTDCYQFIRFLIDHEIQNHKKNIPIPAMNTLDILEYVDQKSITVPQTRSLNKHQVKNRKEREEKWKNWLANREQRDVEMSDLSEKFIEEYVEPVTLQYSDKLLPFQIKHVKNLLVCLKSRNVALDASDTGTGKTYSALCVAKELQLIPIIVCPKAIIPGWKRAMGHYDHKEYYVSNYEQYRAGNTPYVTKVGINQIYYNCKTKEEAARIPKYEYLWKIDPEKHILIFDECHKVKNTTTLNYAIFWWAKQVENMKIISLSATVADKIENAYGICYMLNLVEDARDFNASYNLTGDKRFLKDFGYEVGGDGSYKFNRKYSDLKAKLQNENTNLTKLHNDIFPVNGSRMVIADLGDAFPENFVEAQTYDMDRRGDKIQSIYQEMEQNILRIKAQTVATTEEDISSLEAKMTTIGLNQIEADRLKNLKKNYQENIDKLENMKSKLADHGQNTKIEHLNKKDRVHTNMLTVMLRARQRVELLKAETLVDLGVDFLEQGKSVVIFINFIETLEYLLQQKKLSKHGVSVVRGGQDIKTRQQQIDLFQNNTNRVIMLTMKSGRESISLHDLEGGYPRVSLISPSWSAQDLVQALGRIHRAEGKSKCLQYLIYCAGTIEDRICELVQQKLKTINAINDGDLSDPILGQN